MTTEIWVKRAARKAARAVGIVALIYVLAKLTIAQIIYFTESTVNYSEELTYLPKCPRDGSLKEYIKNYLIKNILNDPN